MRDVGNTTKEAEIEKNKNAVTDKRIQRFNRGLP